MGRLSYKEKKAIAEARGIPKVVNAFELRSNIVDKAKKAYKTKTKTQTVPLQGTARTVSDIQTGVLKTESGFYAVDGYGVATGRAAESLQALKQQETIQFLQERQPKIMTTYESPSQYMDRTLTGLEEGYTKEYLKSKEFSSRPFVKFTKEVWSRSNEIASKATNPIFSSLKISNQAIRKYEKPSYSVFTESGKTEPVRQKWLINTAFVQTMSGWNKIMSDAGEKPLSTGTKYAALYAGGYVIGRGLAVAGKSSSIAIRTIPKGTAYGVGVLGIGAEGARYAFAGSNRKRGEILFTAGTEFAVTGAGATKGARLTTEAPRATKDPKDPLEGVLSLKRSKGQTPLQDFGVGGKNAKFYLKEAKSYILTKIRDIHFKQNPDFVVIQKQQGSSLFQSMRKSNPIDKSANFFHSPFKSIRQSEKLLSQNRVLFRTEKTGDQIKITEISPRQAFNEWKFEKQFTKRQAGMEKQNKLFYDTVRKYQMGKLSESEFNKRIKMFSYRDQLDLGKARLPGRKPFKLIEMDKQGTFSSKRSGNLLKTETVREVKKSNPIKPSEKFKSDSPSNNKLFRGSSKSDTGRFASALPKSSALFSSSLSGYPLTGIGSALKSQPVQGQMTTPRLIPFTGAIGGLALLPISRLGGGSGKGSSDSGGGGRGGGGGSDTFFTGAFPFNLPGGGIYSRLSSRKERLQNLRYNPSISAQVLNIKASRPGKGWQTGLGLRPILGGVKRARRTKK